MGNPAWSPFFKKGTKYKPKMVVFCTFGTKYNHFRLVSVNAMIAEFLTRNKKNDEIRLL